MITNHTFKSIIAQTLHESVSSYVVEEFVSMYSTPYQLLDLTERELTAIKGIGPKKAKQLMAVIQLAKMLLTPPVEQAVIKSPEDVFNLLRMEVGFEKREFFMVLFLDTKNKVIAKETLSIGSLNASIVHPMCIFRAAIKHAAASIICAHNHPSGDPTPSSEDITVTKRLIEAGDITGIDVLDHIVLGSHKYISLKERGLI
jgi:DNA repair protein RadC